jgi:hypothetical protein
MYAQRLLRHLAAPADRQPATPKHLHRAHLHTECDEAKCKREPALWLPRALRSCYET